jgi:WD40 repeat protein
VEDVAFTPDGSQLVISTGWGDGGDYVLWDTRSKDMVGSVRADDAAVFTSAVSPDGHTVMSGGQTGAVRLWDLSTGTLLGSLNGLTGSAASVGFTPDGRTAVASDTSGNVLLWDVPSRSTIGDPLPGPTSDGVAAATLTPDGRRLVVVSDSGAGWVWNVDPADWLTRACAVAGRSFTQPEWDKFLPDRAYQPTCRS